MGNLEKKLHANGSCYSGACILAGEPEKALTGLTQRPERVNCPPVNTHFGVFFAGELPFSFASLQQAPRLIPKASSNE
jgi:hypothetical protein